MTTTPESHKGAPVEVAAGGPAHMDELQRDLGVVMGALVSMQNSATAFAKSRMAGDLTALCARYGVDAPLVAQPAKYEPIGGGGLVELGDIADAPIGWDGSPPDMEIGAPGTPMVDGRIVVDPNPSKGPRAMRSTMGHVASARYATIERDDAVYKSLQSIRELVVTGDWQLSQGEAQNPNEQAYLEWARSWVWGKLRSIEGGLPCYVESLTRAISWGVVAHEVVWQRFGPIWFPVKLAARESATINKWLMDEHQRELLGVRFQLSGQHARTYSLPTTGPLLTDRRCLVTTFNRTGNNFDGLPPTRVADFYVACKQLLWAITAVAFERFGSPILVASLDINALAQYIQAGGGDVDRTQLEGLVRMLARMQARQTPTMEAPTGVNLQYVGPAGQMPDTLAIIQYIDSRIQMLFSTQGMGLGHAGVGSYALAEVQDSDFLRAMPYYTEVLTRPINDLLRVIFEHQFGVVCDEYPRLVWAPRLTQDASKWIDDMLKVHAAAATLPRPALDAALERLGLPPDTYDEEQ